MSEVHGLCGEAFSAVREGFAENLATGADVGASFVVTRNDEVIIDIWGGFCDEAKTKPWEKDSIANVYSTTKTMAALCLHVLSDKGEVDLHAPVARYWPEFAQEDKKNVEVRHFLSHASGLPGWDEPMAAEDLYDWEKCTTLLARQRPWWEPGTKSGYHAITQGYLLGEVVRRVTGRTIGAFFAEEIAGPLGTDFHIGTGAEHDARIALLIPPENEGETAPGGEGAPMAEFTVRALGNPPVRAIQSHEIDWRRAEIPAANGHGNARSVAQTLSVLANGGTSKGKTLLSEAGAKRILEVQTEGIDVVLGLPVSWALGYGLRSDIVPVGPNPNTCFWGGYGGSIAIIDQDAHVTISYVMNRMVASLVDQSRVGKLILGFYTALAEGN